MIEITHKINNHHLMIYAKGRLDASCAEFFADTGLNHIRQGHHNLIIEASELSFLSSAGLRALFTIQKELSSVKGSLHVINAIPFVANTIEMTGFKKWLEMDPTFSMDMDKGDVTTETEKNPEVWILDTDASLTLSVHDAWKPFQTVSLNQVVPLSFPSSRLALGIGCPQMENTSGSHPFGEFMGILGHVIFQPPDEKSRPDYLISEDRFIPELNVIQALSCTGSMSHLFRFAPVTGHLNTSIGTLAQKALNLTEKSLAAFVIIAETSGLVGATLIKAPGLDDTVNPPPFPEIRNWLSFCGEKSFTGHQSIIFGVVGDTNKVNHLPLLKSLPSLPEISGHFHAAVFPYQPMQNGKIDLFQTIRKFLNGPPPQALMHLIDDQRPLTGIGQSTLLRGACWCAPVNNLEELL